MNEFDQGIMKPGIEKYAVDHTSAELPVLARLFRATHLRTHQPQMLSGHLQGAFLQMISHMIKPAAILEIGTFTGYSAICLAQGLQDGGKLITIDCNPEMEDFTKPYFEEAGLNDKIELIIGDATEIIESLHGLFDLVFIDADKENYINYFKMVFPKISPGGYIMADNTLWYGRVIEPNAESDRETAGIVRFNTYVQQLEGVENILLPIRDGIMMVRKKPE
ncbi:MAG: O-methyltransferase [Bacteroidales bacterium]|nr:O-methyltransferase [Bacteroidales bacterium]